MAYAVQIYADFSGYTDIAIGVALLLGIRFPQNFDRPYSATSLQDFWRRWHITLSRVAARLPLHPAGREPGGKRAEERNLVITMGLGGLWHGASWNFVIWGLLHGFGLVTRAMVARTTTAGHRPAGPGGRDDTGADPRRAPPSRSPWLPSTPSFDSRGEPLRPGSPGTPSESLGDHGHGPSDRGTDGRARYAPNRTRGSHGSSSSTS